MSYLDDGMPLDNFADKRKSFQMLHQLRQIILCSLVVISSASASGETNLPPLRRTDQIRLREAIRFVDAVFDSVWAAGARPPLEVLFVDDSVEYLINHDGQTPDFASTAYDSVLDRPVKARRRTYPTGFLATFPAFSSYSTIVVGRPENTLPKTSTPWVAIIAHERLHQVQDAEPGISEKLIALDLSGADSTGMWMLNYSFPYDSIQVGEAYDAYISSLVAALDGRGTAEFPSLIAAAIAARDHLRSLLSDRDYRYMAFQLWKEGIARYSEYMFSRLAARWYLPTKEFSQLPDFESFDTTARRIYENSLAELYPHALHEMHRVVFYATGLAEGLLLDEYAPGWRARYFAEPLDTRSYFDKVP